MAAASRARGWAPRPLLLLPLLLGPLVPAGCAAAARLSLHPPYFNLAEAARIWATATCGKREAGSTRPRPELYCKLVGGPPAPGSGHPIQATGKGPPVLARAGGSGSDPAGAPPLPTRPRRGCAKRAKWIEARFSLGTRRTRSEAAR
nr:laminin subunit alpha-3-like [Manis javanica]